MVHCIHVLLLCVGEQQLGVQEAREEGNFNLLAVMI